MSPVTWLILALGVVTAFVMAFVWVMAFSIWKMKAESKG